MCRAGVFNRWPYPFEINKAGKEGKKKDLPLCEVLKYFQAEEFRSELYKFGLIGFDRFGRVPQDVNYPYARRHVYKVRICRS